MVEAVRVRPALQCHRRDEPSPQSRVVAALKQAGPEAHQQGFVPACLIQSHGDSRHGIDSAPCHVMRAAPSVPVVVKLQLTGPKRPERRSGVSLRTGNADRTDIFTLVYTPSKSAQIAHASNMFESTKAVRYEATRCPNSRECMELVIWLTMLSSSQNAQPAGSRPKSPWANSRRNPT